MSWRYGDQTAVHGLPIGATQRAAVGDAVRAGDVIAAGTTCGSSVRIAAARTLGVAPQDLGRVMRVPPGAEVERGAIIARTGRRFARAVSAPFEGRLVHVRADGDLEFAPIVDRWSVRATLDGLVTASTEASITVVGRAWALQGVAGYGPDAIGELAVAVDGPGDELPPSRVDVRQRDRILVGGGRSGPEAIARAHACGVAAVVAGAVPAAGLRVMYGDDVSAHGDPTRGDVPTVLCLLGFGSGPLPVSIFAPLVALAGARASIHTASARLFAFAPPDACAVDLRMPALALVADWAAVRPLDWPAALSGEIAFPSEIAAPAVGTPDGRIPAANVLPFSADRG
jgi:hypothetical protein